MDKEVLTSQFLGWCPEMCSKCCRMIPSMERRARASLKTVNSS